MSKKWLLGVGENCDCKNKQGGFLRAYNILLLYMDAGYIGVWFIIILCVLCSLLYTCYTLLEKV